MRVTLVFNPTAGKYGLETSDIEGRLVQAGHRVRLCNSKKEDLDSVLTKAADLVLVAGGDGTVGKVLRRIQRAGVPVAICPVGSANNIATALGQDHVREEIVHALEELVVDLASGRPHRLDVGIARGPWGRRRFVEGVGLGALARALAAANETGASGDESVGLGRAAFRSLLDDAEPARLHLELDGTLLADSFAFIEVLNISCIGPRLSLAPDAQPGDGFLDVVCLPFEQCREMIDWLDAPDARPPPVEAKRVRRARVTCDTRVGVHVDDALLPLEQDTSFEVTLEVEGPPVRVLVLPCEGAVSETRHERDL